MTKVIPAIRKTVFETNYDRLIKLAIFQEKDDQDTYKKSISGSYMDLIVERLPHMDCVTGQKGVAFSIAHYFKQNGDLCADPEMVILVYPSLKMVEVLTFQQAIPPIYQEVYPEPNKYFPRLKKDLNSFLRQWLNNLIEQGHGVNWAIELED